MGNENFVTKSVDLLDKLREFYVSLYTSGDVDPSVIFSNIGVSVITLHLPPKRLTVVMDHLQPLNVLPPSICSPVVNLQVVMEFPLTSINNSGRL